MKLLIVDDERWIRMGLKVKIKNLGYYFSEVYEAKNGVEGLALIQEHQPEIVITDVRMPKKNGLDVIEEGKQIAPKTKFIIISGYAEFEYAEKAINMGAKGYLLKPIEEENLRDTMKRVIDEIEKEQQVKRAELKVVRFEKDQAFVAKEKQLNDYLTGDSETLDESLFFDGEDRNYVLAIMNIDASSYFSSHFKYEDLELLKFSIKNIIGDVLQEETYLVCDNYSNKNQLLLLYADVNQMKVHYFENQQLLEIITYVKQYLEISTTVGLSDIYTSIQRDMFKEAKDAYNFNIFDGKGKIYNYQNVKYALEYAADIPKEKFNLFKMHVAKRDSKNIRIILENIFQEDGGINRSPHYLSFLWFEAVGIIVNAVEGSVKAKSHLRMRLLEPEVMAGCDSLEDMVNYLYTTCVNELRLKEGREVDCKKIIYRIKEYMEQNFDKNIVVKDLAREYALNPKYLSTLFKKEFSMSPNQYLTTMRLKNACHLLTTTKDSITNISNSVGYNDHLYFFRVFKKHYNMTPLEYRNEHMDNEKG